MKVSELFESEKISKEDVINMADESSYWQSSSDFVINNWNREIESMTNKQVSWLTRIHDDLTEMRIEGEL